MSCFRSIERAGSFVGCTSTWPDGRNREVALAPALHLVEVGRIGDGKGISRLPVAVTARGGAAHANMIHTFSHSLVGSEFASLPTRTELPVASCQLPSCRSLLASSCQPPRRSVPALGRSARQFASLAGRHHVQQQVRVTLGLCSARRIARATCFRAVASCPAARSQLSAELRPTSDHPYIARQVEAEPASWNRPLDDRWLVAGTVRAAGRPESDPAVTASGTACGGGAGTDPRFWDRRRRISGTDG